MEQEDVGLYMIDQDPEMISKNQEILARIRMLGGQIVGSGPDVLGWISRLRKEGMGK